MVEKTTLLGVLPPKDTYCPIEISTLLTSYRDKSEKTAIDVAAILPLLKNCEPRQQYRPLVASTCHAIVGSMTKSELMYGLAWLLQYATDEQKKCFVNEVLIEMIDILITPMIEKPTLYISPVTISTLAMMLEFLSLLKKKLILKESQRNLYSEIKKIKETADEKDIFLYDYVLLLLEETKEPPQGRLYTLLQGLVDNLGTGGTIAVGIMGVIALFVFSTSNPAGWSIGLAVATGLTLAPLLFSFSLSDMWVNIKDILASPHLSELGFYQTINSLFVVLHSEEVMSKSWSDILKLLKDNVSKHPRWIKSVMSTLIELYKVKACTDNDKKELKELIVGKFNEHGLHEQRTIWIECAYLLLQSGLTLQSGSTPINIIDVQVDLLDLRKKSKNYLKYIAFYKKLQSTALPTSIKSEFPNISDLSSEDFESIIKTQEEWLLKSRYKDLMEIFYREKIVDTRRCWKKSFFTGVDLTKTSSFVDFKQWFLPPASSRKVIVSGKQRTGSNILGSLLAEELYGQSEKTIIWMFQCPQMHVSTQDVSKVASLRRETFQCFDEEYKKLSEHLGYKIHPSDSTDILLERVQPFLNNIKRPWLLIINNLFDPVWWDEYHTRFPLDNADNRYIVISTPKEVPSAFLLNDKTLEEEFIHLTRRRCAEKFFFPDSSPSAIPTVLMSAFERPLTSQIEPIIITGPTYEPKYLCNRWVKEQLTANIDVAWIFEFNYRENLQKSQEEQFREQLAIQYEQFAVTVLGKQVMPTHFSPEMAITQNLVLSNTR